MNDSHAFSYLVDAARIGGGADYRLRASAEERAALVHRFGLIALDRLEARVRLVPVPGGFYRVTAELEAEFTQECVLTLEPVPIRIAESFTLLYGVLEEAREIVLDSGAETVEPLENGVIDIAEAVAQQLSLAIDPFPRAPGAAAAVPAADAPIASPFAVLAKLRKTEQG